MRKRKANNNQEKEAKNKKTVILDKGNILFLKWRTSFSIKKLNKARDIVKHIFCKY